MKYSIAFASIAIGLAMLAVIDGGGLWLLAWPAISFGWVAIAYAANCPCCLGKQSTGRISLGYVDVDKQ